MADSRPRVRGRFAKNDEFGESIRQASSSHHDDEDEDDVRNPVYMNFMAKWNVDFQPNLIKPVWFYRWE